MLKIVGWCNIEVKLLKILSITKNSGEPKLVSFKGKVFLSVLFKFKKKILTKCNKIELQPVKRGLVAIKNSVEIIIFFHKLLYLKKGQIINLQAIIEH